ncbi:MAG: hypothetical protein HY867_00005 [Chloroflexi bacterium]|nr:hypothetical protein [Chloroflexota bacterium]
MLKTSFYFRKALTWGVTVALLFVAFVIMVVPAVHAQAESAPLVCPSSALVYGDLVQCSISTPAEGDAYGFLGNTGDKILVRMSKSSGTLYPEIRVYNPDGFQICQDWDYTASEIATCTLTATGMHSIQVGDYGGTKTGDYYLYLQRLNGPGYPTSIAFGQTLSASILFPAEMDAFTFVASAGDKVIVRMAKASGTLYPEIRVYNPTGLQLCQDWDYTTSEIATCTLTETGP